MKIYKIPKVLILLAFLFSYTAKAQVIINEISYNPPESGTDSLEYIELYNAGGTDVSLDGWHFTSGVEDTFPNISLGAGAYFVVAVKASAMMAVFGVQSREWSGGALSNSGETITLVDASDNLVDSVAFDDADPWPIEADGSGPSLELRDAALDNNDGTNWQISGGNTGVIINGFEVSGTPGAENSGGGTGGPAVTIEAAHLEFTPQNAVVELGDVVRWVNQEAIPHNVNGKMDTYPNNPTDIYSGAPAVGPWQFDYTTIETGYYQYQCDVHAIQGMVGTLGVYDPLTYTDFPLRVLRLTDGVNGSHIYDGVPTRVTGVVHGVNFLPTGYSFYVIDDENVGINVFAPAPGIYTVQQGDRVTVSGVIDQFNGLLEIIPDDIEVLATGQPINTAQTIDVPDEETEGSYVHTELLDVDSAVVTGASGFNVFAKNINGDPVLVRFDADAGIPLEATDFYEHAWLEVWGIGTQFDPSFPFTDGYQVLALEAYIIIDGLPFLQESAVTMDPNPVSSYVEFKSDLFIERLEVLSLDGKVIRAETINSSFANLNVDDLMQGMYVVRAVTTDGIWTSKIIKE